MTGRALAVVEGIAADLQPAGWRLTDTSGASTTGAPGRCSPRTSTPSRSWPRAAPARSRPRSPGRGPSPRRSRSRGATRCSATTEPDRDLARRSRRDCAPRGRPAPPAGRRRPAGRPGRRAGARRRRGREGPTASGFGRHRTVDLPEASAHLEWLVTAITDAGAEAWVHSCAPQTPWFAGRGTGVTGLSADLAMLGPADLDTFAEALEQGRTPPWAWCRPPTRPPQCRTRGSSSASSGWLDMLGLDAEEVGDRLVLTPSCGLAGAWWPVGARGAAGAAPQRDRPVRRLSGVSGRRTAPRRRAPRGSARRRRRASAGSR